MMDEPRDGEYDYKRNKYYDARTERYYDREYYYQLLAERRNILPDLEHLNNRIDQIYPENRTDYEESKRFYARREMIKNMVTNLIAIQKIINTLEPIYQYDSRNYTKEMKQLYQERSRLAHMIKTCIDNYLPYDFEQGGTRFMHRHQGLMHTMSEIIKIVDIEYMPRIDSPYAKKRYASYEEIDEKQELLESVEKGIKEIDDILENASEFNPIVEDVKRELEPIRRTHPARTEKVGYRTLKKLLELKSRQIDIDYLDELYRHTLFAVKKNINKFPLLKQELERKGLRLTRKSYRLVERISRKLHLNYDSLTAEKANNDKKIKNLETKFESITKVTDLTSRAVKEYKDDLNKNEEDIQFREDYRNRNVPEVKELEDTLERINYDLNKTSNRRPAITGKERERLLFSKKQIERELAALEKRAKEGPSIKQLPKEYTNMEEKINQIQGRAR